MDFILNDFVAKGSNLPQLNDKIENYNEELVIKEEKPRKKTMRDVFIIPSKREKKK